MTNKKKEHRHLKLNLFQIIGHFKSQHYQSSPILSESCATAYYLLMNYQSN